ncbi:MAG: lactonase family protein [Actinomycetales bacterium]
MSELVLIAVAGDDSICTLRLHRDPRPRLELLARTSGLPGCGTFAVDPERALVFAAYKGDPPGVATLSLNPETGELSEVDRRPVAASMTYLSLAHSGTVLLGASYGGGLGVSWPVEAEQLGEPVSTISFANLHCVVACRDGDAERAYFVSLGQDLVAQYLVEASGRLDALTPETVSVTPGCGPRHLIVEADAGYLVTEYSGEVFRLARAGDGTLSVVQSVVVVDPGEDLAHSRLGADPTAEHLIWGADVHRAGDWLLTSERSSSKLASVPVRVGGELGEADRFTPTQAQPRGFGVTGDGEFVVVVGERSQEAALSRLNPDGSLTLLDTATVGSGANWVRMLS